ncbi:MAG: response regulator [Candidatus Rokubacteria bacterium]|nr:response regulator [Candidatus Rokubacteria bacterium]
MERTILVAEDSPTQAERVRLLLESAGYRVDVAVDGREGLHRVRLTPPDLIISDVVMPRMDGYTFCQAVKSSEATRRIPFVLLTERNTALDIVKGLEKGADNFITKPFEDGYLIERVGRIFEHLELRERGHFEMEVSLRVGQREVLINADKQQIVELLFSTFEELCRLNGELTEAKQHVEAHARTLEAKVQERTRELQGLFDGVPVGLYRSTPDGRILDANPALVQMFGYKTRAALFAANAATLYVDPEDRARWQALIERDGVVRNFEVRARQADGTVFWVRHSGRAVRNTAGRIVHYQGAVEDVTAQRRAEEALQRQRETLYQREKLAAMGSLLAGVAHELNNPLSVVIGRTGLLRKRLGEGPVAIHADKIAQAAERCVRIVKNFLALARERPPERQEVDLNPVVEEALELLAYTLRVDDIEVRFEPADDLPRLWADPHQLHQVVVNLVTNAHHAMRGTPPPRRITLATRFDRDRVSLRVADTGPGVPPETQSRIFEPFFTTKPSGQGTGLGLSLCQGIVEAHQGTIRLASEPGQGAAFLVELPVEAPRPSVRAEPEAEPAPATTGKHILVVDDEAEIAAILAEILTEEGHHVETAENGAAALEMLHRRTYDLILSDLRMPELDGPGLYRALQQHHPQLLGRVVFLTGDTLEPHTLEFLRETGAPSLNKPFAEDEVQALVRRLLSARD